MTSSYTGGMDAEIRAGSSLLIHMCRMWMAQAVTLRMNGMRGGKNGCENHTSE